MTTDLDIARNAAAVVALGLALWWSTTGSQTQALIFLVLFTVYQKLQEIDERLDARGLAP